MILYFLRHANAGERLPNPRKDEKRALDPDGIEQCGYVGRALAALEVQVDAIASSPLKRCTQTASLVGTEIGYDGKILMENALRPDATFNDFRTLLNRLSKHESVMVVGHNPTLSEFLGRMISSGGGEAAVNLKKGAVAKVELRRHSAELHWCLTPKVVRTLYSAAAESARPKSSRK
jgi:phosphohistidine phosphatase